MNDNTTRSYTPFLKLAIYAYGFFLAITALGSGMKSSFKHPLERYLHTHGGEFDELTSFVIGVLGTSLVQSSSTVTSMAVDLTKDGTVPLLIAIGIVHGANLGTSVTSSIVAFFTDAQPMSGNPLRDAWHLLTGRRRAGFRRAVGTAVVHDMFNIMMVIGLLLVLELPFGLVARASVASASVVGAGAAQLAGATDLLAWLSPKTYTGPVVAWIADRGVPGWGLVIGGFLLLFYSLRLFAGTMRGVILDGTDPEDVHAVGDRILGKTAPDTFLRGLVLTILIQSSSATTSMVVPLAAMGFFSVRRIFPFILGANIGTTATAVIVAASALADVAPAGTPLVEGQITRAEFEAGVTIALSHVYLNTLAVVLVVALPPLKRSILGNAEMLADAAERFPGTLLLYLGALVIGMPLLVFTLPLAGAAAVLGAVFFGAVVAPHFYLARKAGRGEATVF